MTRPTHDRRSADGRSYLMRSIELGLAEFLASPAAGRPRGLDGSYMVDAHVGGWTNGDVIVAALGSAGIDARDPATFGAVRTAHDAPPDCDTFRAAWRYVARPCDRRGRRDWRDLDLATLADCHPAFAALALPPWVTDATIDDAAAAWMDAAPDLDDPPPCDDAAPDGPAMEVPPMTAPTTDDDRPFDEDESRPSPTWIPRAPARADATIDSTSPVWDRAACGCFVGYVEDRLFALEIAPKERRARISAWRTATKGRIFALRCVCGRPVYGDFSGDLCGAGHWAPEEQTGASPTRGPALFERDGRYYLPTGESHDVTRGSLAWIAVMRLEARALLDLPASALTSDVARARRRNAPPAPLPLPDEFSDEPTAAPARKTRPAWLRVVTDDDAPPAK